MSLINLDEKYTYADYLSWNDDKRWEIIDGTAYMQAAPSRIHQKISLLLSVQFANYLDGKDCEIYTAPFCVRLDNNINHNDIKNVVEPDITIICDKSKLDDRGCIGSPDMIVEIVSPSSSKRDKIQKFNKYEKYGVKEYWIIEPDQKIVTVFLLDSNGRYGRPEFYTDEDKVKVSIFKDLEINLNKVFID